MGYPVWSYALVGAGAVFSVGLSAVFAAGTLLRKRPDPNQPPEPGVLDVISASIPIEEGQGSQSSGAGHETTLAVPGHVGVMVSAGEHGSQLGVKGNRNNDGFSTGQLMLGTFLLTAGLFMSNWRAFTMWQRRRKQGEFDAEKFQRAFDKFMEGRGYHEWEGRTYSREEARAKYKQEFEDFWTDFDQKFDQREQYFKEEARRYREWKRTHRSRGQYSDGDGSEHFRSHRTGSGSFADASWESPEVRNALRVLGIDSIRMKPSELKAVYLKKAKETHPDGWPEDEKQAAEDRFKRVGAAYEVLRPIVGNN